MSYKGPKDLKVWVRSIEMVVECYRLTRLLPDSERYGLKSQIERAAVSVPANIAEGHGRGYKKAFISHLWIANGSLAELQTHFVIAEHLNYFAKTETDSINSDIVEIGKMITGLRRSLER